MYIDQCKKGNSQQILPTKRGRLSANITRPNQFSFLIINLWYAEFVSIAGGACVCLTVVSTLFNADVLYVYMYIIVTHSDYSMCMTQAPSMSWSRSDIVIQFHSWLGSHWVGDLVSPYIPANVTSFQAACACAIAYNKKQKKTLFITRGAVTVSMFGHVAMWDSMYMYCQLHSLHNTSVLDLAEFLRSSLRPQGRHNKVHGGTFMLVMGLKTPTRIMVEHFGHSPYLA